MKAIKSAQVAEEAFARVLILGQMKIGKTSALCTTAPRPVIINCDGIGATQYAAIENGSDFWQLDVNGLKTWGDAVKEACRMANDGEVETIIVDSVTLLSDELHAELAKSLSGFDLWGGLALELQSGLRRLMKAPAHVFLVAHIDPSKDSSAGILPLIGGNTKVWLPAKVSDWVLFSYESGRKPDPRAFLVGPQDDWPRSGRRIRRSIEICPPDVGDLLEELGF